MLYSRFSLVNYFIHSSVCMLIPISQFIPLSLPCLVSRTLFCITISISVLQKGHLYHFSRSHMKAILYDICFSVADLLHCLTTLLYFWWECELVQALWRAVWRFLRKLKIELPCDPAIPLLGTYLEKTIIQKDTCTPVFIAAVFTIARTWKQAKCLSTEEWLKMWYIYSMEY